MVEDLARLAELVRTSRSRVLLWATSTSFAAGWSARDAIAAIEAERAFAGGLAVLDDAHHELRALAPSRWLTWAELQRRRSTFRTPARTAEEIRNAAARSWGLPVDVEGHSAGRQTA